MFCDIFWFTGALFSLLPFSLPVGLQLIVWEDSPPNVECRDVKPYEP